MKQEKHNKKNKLASDYVKLIKLSLNKLKHVSQKTGKLKMYSINELFSAMYYLLRSP